MGEARGFTKRVLDLRPGEGAPLAALMFLSFCKGGAAVLFDTAANTHFIRLFSVSRLPLIYLAAAGVSLLVGSLYSALAARFDVRRMLLGTLAAGAGMLCLIYLGFLRHPAPWLVLAAMVWKEALFILSNMVLWATAGYLFDLRQGKRLFGLVVAGSIAAGILGGLVVPWLVRTAGLSQLFLFSALAMLAMLGSLWTIMARYPEHFHVKNDVHHPAPPAKAKSTPILHLFRNRYLGLFLGLSILSNFGFFFADYAYFNRVSNAFHDEASLATFFGHFSAVLGGVQLVASLFLSGPVITRFGLGCALMALPVASGIGMASAAGVGLLLGMNGAFFWLIIVTKLCDEALRASLLAPAFRILYQPLPARERLAFQAKTESIIEPMGVGLAGGVLVLLTACLSLPLPRLCLILVLILAVWIGVAELLRHEYTRMLAKALSHRRLSGAAMEIIDGSSADLFIRGTESANPGEVIYCLSMLEAVADPRLTERLQWLADHPQSQVREFLFKRATALGALELLETARRAWRSDPDPKVRQAAMRAYVGIGKNEVMEEVAALLAADLAPEIRAGALAGMLYGGTIDGVVQAGSHLQLMALSPEPAERIDVTEILGNAGTVRFARLLDGLLADESVPVARAAVRAAGKLRDLDSIPLLLRALSRRALRPAALAALRNYGERLIAPIAAALQLPQPPEVRRGLVLLLGWIEGSETAALLISSLSWPDKTIRGHVLTSLTMLRYQTTPASEPGWKEMIRQLVKESAWSLETAGLFQEAARWPLVAAALEEEAREDRKQILLLLAFFPGAQALRLTGKKLESRSSAQRAQAVELLENLIPADLKKEVMPLLDGSASASVSAFGQAGGGSGWETRLIEIAEASPRRFQRWTRSCALQAIGLEKIEAGRAAVRNGVGEDDFMIRETAEWAAARGNFGSF